MRDIKLGGRAKHGMAILCAVGRNEGGWVFLNPQADRFLDVERSKRTKRKYGWLSGMQQAQRVKSDEKGPVGAYHRTG